MEFHISYDRDKFEYVGNESYNMFLINQLTDVPSDMSKVVGIGTNMEMNPQRELKGKFATYRFKVKQVPENFDKEFKFIETADPRTLFLDKPGNELEFISGPIYTTKESKGDIKTIPFTSSITEDANQYTDYEQVTTVGKNGSETPVFEIEYKDGVEIAKKEIRVDKVAPVNEVKTVGTKPIITTSREERTEAIPFSTKTEYDPTLDKGQTRVKQEGVDGVKTLTYEITYNKGEKTGERKVDEKVTKEAVDKIILSGTKVVVEIKTETKTEKIPYKTEERPSADDYRGVRKVITKGVEGSKTVTYEVRYEDGKEVAREVIESITTKEAVNEVVTVGTKPRPSTGGGTTPVTPKPETPKPGTENKIPTERIAGSDRIATAIAVSKDKYEKAGTVIIARHDDYPDSLSASVLAKLKNAPILLTRTGELDPRVKAEIERLGATEIIIVGGENAVSANTEKALNTFDQEIERLEGDNRYETSAAIARKVVELSGAKGKAIIASGQSFADALAISPYAAKEGIPILLSRPNSVDAVITTVIADLKINEVVIVGGEAALSKSIEGSLPKVSKRIGGDTRYETATLIAKEFFADSTLAYIASGEEFADALVIGSTAGENNAPVLLTPSVAARKSVIDYIKGSKINKLIVIGGTARIPESVVNPLAVK